MNRLPYDLCAGNIVFLSIFDEFSICYFIDPYLDITIFWILNFWPSCPWTHFITSLFVFHKFIIIYEFQKVKCFI